MDPKNDESDSSSDSIIRQFDQLVEKVFTSQNLRKNIFGAKPRNKIQLRPSVVDRAIQKPVVVTSTPMPVNTNLNFSISNENTVSPILVGNRKEEQRDSSTNSISLTPTSNDLQKDDNLPQARPLKKISKLDQIICRLHTKQNNEESIEENLNKSQSRNNFAKKLGRNIFAPIVVPSATTQTSSQSDSPSSSALSDLIRQSDAMYFIPKRPLDKPLSSCQTSSNNGKPWRVASDMQSFKIDQPTIKNDFSDDELSDETFCPKFKKKKRVFANRRTTRFLQDQKLNCSRNRIGTAVGVSDKDNCEKTVVDFSNIFAEALLQQKPVLKNVTDLASDPKNKASPPSKITPETVNLSNNKAKDDIRCNYVNEKKVEEQINKVALSSPRYPIRHLRKELQPGKKETAKVSHSRNKKITKRKSPKKNQQVANKSVTFYDFYPKNLADTVTEEDCANCVINEHVTNLTTALTEDDFSAIQENYASTVITNDARTKTKNTKSKSPKKARNATNIATDLAEADVTSVQENCANSVIFKDAPTKAENTKSKFPKKAQNAKNFATAFAEAAVSTVQQDCANFVILKDAPTKPENKKRKSPKKAQNATNLATAFSETYVSTVQEDCANSVILNDAPTKAENTKKKSSKKTQYSTKATDLPQADLTTIQKKCANCIMTDITENAKRKSPEKNRIDTNLTTAFAEADAGKIQEDCANSVISDDVQKETSNTKRKSSKKIGMAQM